MRGVQEVASNQSVGEYEFCLAPFWEHLVSQVDEPM